MMEKDSPTALTRDTRRAERACEANRNAASDRLAHMGESITR